VREVGAAERAIEELSRAGGVVYVLMSTI